jgi:hypothetical protein
MRLTKTCVACEAEFSFECRSAGERKTCSPECWRLHRNMRRMSYRLRRLVVQPKQTKTCVVCEAEFVVTIPGGASQRKTCSPECRRSHNNNRCNAALPRQKRRRRRRHKLPLQVRKNCVECGMEFTTPGQRGRRRDTCSAACWADRRQRQKGGWRHPFFRPLQLQAINCIECSKEFTPTRHGKSICSASCKSKRQARLHFGWHKMRWIGDPEYRERLRERKREQGRRYTALNLAALDFMNKLTGEIRPRTRAEAQAALRDLRRIGD